MARILVVNDHPETAQMLMTTLTRLGHDVTLLFDGKQAVELMKLQQFDLWVIDWLLPGYPGSEILQTLYALASSEQAPQRRLLGTPILFHSNLDFHELKIPDPAGRFEFIRYLPKPSRISELLGVIADILD